MAVLIDIQAPDSFIQPGILQKTNPVTSYHPNGSFLLFTDNIPFYCHKYNGGNELMEGVNILGAFFLKSFVDQ